MLLDITLAYMPYSINYAFTITLKPNLYRFPAEKQYDETFSYVNEKLLTIASQLTMVAELTKSQNVHYHGSINFLLHKLQAVKSCVKTFHDLFRSDHLIGFVNIKPIDDENGWSDYISKDFKTFSEVIQRRPIIHDSFDVFTEQQHADYAITW